MLYSVEASDTEKNLSYGVLLDIYGQLLTERQCELLGLYYNDDYSLSEISENTGISRQGVRDAIKRGEAELDRLERSLGMADIFSEAESIAAELESAAEGASPALRQTILRAASRVRSLAERQSGAGDRDKDDPEK